jgi:RNA exonuclease 1
MMHPYVIDTSVIYNITGDRFRKTKLALLAQRFLGEEIQQGKQGHCSLEDSLTCMKLTQLKLANGRLICFFFM